MKRKLARKVVLYIEGNTVIVELRWSRNAQRLCQIGHCLRRLQIRSNATGIIKYTRERKIPEIR